MKIDDYKVLLNDMMDADKSASTLVTIVDALTADLAERDDYATKYNEATTTNNSLRELNSRLALRIVGVQPTIENESVKLNEIEKTMKEGL